MKKAYQWCKGKAVKVLSLAGAVVATAATSEAGIDMTGVTIDTSDPFAMAGKVAVALGAIWAIRKVIKILTHS